VTRAENPACGAPATSAEPGDVRRHAARDHRASALTDDRGRRRGSRYDDFGRTADVLVIGNRTGSTSSRLDEITPLGANG
jgi:hypothetical protein